MARLLADAVAAQKKITDRRRFTMPMAQQLVPWRYAACVLLVQMSAHRA